VDALVPVAIALGSNLGDRRAHLDWAVDELSSFVSGLRASSYVETEPVDVPDLQPRYLNAAAVGRTDLSARDVLDRLLAIEHARGRTRGSRHAARTLDLDLILFGDARHDAPGLVVPHPRFRERRFVLDPLAEIAADWVDPVTGKTVGEMLREVRSTK
jgi:2-amino-4-hydroxy-6-hydroxymethyldihydropteridine diphosphokinase